MCSFKTQPFKSNSFSSNTKFFHEYAPCFKHAPNAQSCPQRLGSMRSPPLPAFCTVKL